MSIPLSTVKWDPKEVYKCVIQCHSSIFCLLVLENIVINKNMLFMLTCNGFTAVIFKWINIFNLQFNFSVFFWDIYLGVCDIFRFFLPTSFELHVCFSSSFTVIHIFLVFPTFPLYFWSYSLFLYSEAFTAILIFTHKV